MAETQESENMRRIAVALINSEQAERQKLEEIYGNDNVWSTEEVRELFEIVSFCAPCCTAIRKEDGAKGLLTFQHNPRYYFDFTPLK